MTSPDHPWNVLPVDPKGDAEITIIYQAVGQALTQWEGFEGNLAVAFAMLCDARLPGIIRAYGTISSFQGRHDMVEAAFKAYPWNSEDHAAGFLKFLARAKSFAARRNEIAHGRVVQVIAAIGNTGMSGCYLVPADYNTRKRYYGSELADAVDSMAEFTKQVLGRYAYNSKQIDFYADHFSRLAEEARAYTLAFRDRLAPK